MKSLKFEKLLDAIDDVDDILEYINEIFEIDNHVSRSLLCNALMHYFYLPVIVQSVCENKNQFEFTCNKRYKVSVNTALFVLNRTFKGISFHPLNNSICIALLAQQGPSCLI